MKLWELGPCDDLPEGLDHPWYAPYDMVLSFVICPERSKMLARIRAHNRRVKIRQDGGEYSPEDVALQMKSQKSLCWWCGIKLGDGWHIDHRIPVSRDGANTAGNIVISCAPCNLSKSNKLPHEWNGRLL